MKHEGIARRAAVKLIMASLLVAAGVGAAGLLFYVVGALAHLIGVILLYAALVIGVVWVLFAVFTIYFFRDPEPHPPSGPSLVVSPGHGKVDAIEQIIEIAIHGRALPPHFHFFVGD